jgi:hypothetical protein
MSASASARSRRRSPPHALACGFVENGESYGRILYGCMLLRRGRGWSDRQPNAMGYCHCRSCRSWSGGFYARVPQKTIHSPFTFGPLRQTRPHTLRHIAIYSIISAAMASSAGGRVRPSAFAVFTLTRSSNLVG